ncbi:glycosyl hydrolase family 62 protein [Coprinopsis cinerea AmutBmut pab1-1]|nr:glycosyl hydrolase family 62 protein [Coprinopsis cinerea AmutBmut pab1-1]
MAEDTENVLLAFDSRIKLSRALTLAAVATAATSTVVDSEDSVALWGQCGGAGHSGPTQCADGSHCVTVNAAYHQCVPLPSILNWVSTGPLVGPKNDSRQVAGIKDPSVVYHEGTWHVFATSAKSGNWSMLYFNFTDWSEANDAEFFYLDQSGIGPGYRAAPQILYFAPQKLWYLVYQDNNAGYSTNPDISNPAGWSTTKHFYDDVPQIVRDNIGDGYWLDFWVICDAAKCHLFSSDDNGQLYRSETAIADFPDGFNEPVIAMQEANRFDLFEGSCVYRIDGSDKYLLLVEAIGSDNRRWYRSWTSSDIAGPWEALADTESNPFARASNVEFEDGKAWTKDISHGELIRSGYDQNISIDPCKLQFAYQGLDPEAEANVPLYGNLPYRVALLTQTNSSC